MGWLIGISLVAALLFGVWLGRPRPYQQPLDELDELMGEKGEHQTVQRRKTFLNYVQFLRKTKETASSRRRRKAGRRPFDLR